MFALPQAERMFVVLATLQWTVWRRRFEMFALLSVKPVLRVCVCVCKRMCQLVCTSSVGAWCVCLSANSIAVCLRSWSALFGLWEEGGWEAAASRGSTGGEKCIWNKLNHGCCGSKTNNLKCIHLILHFWQFDKNNDVVILDTDAPFDTF